MASARFWQNEANLHGDGADRPRVGCIRRALEVRVACTCLGRVAFGANPSSPAAAVTRSDGVHDPGPRRGRDLRMPRGQGLSRVGASEHSLYPPKTITHSGERGITISPPKASAMP